MTFFVTPQATLCDFVTSGKDISDKKFISNVFNGKRLNRVGKVYK